MSAKGYTNKLQIENYLLITIDDTFDEQIDNWIEDVEGYIDSMTGRNFVADEEASEKRFDGDGQSRLLVDDCVEVESIKLGKDSDPLEIGSDDEPFFLYPQNARTKNPKVPYTSIELAGGRFGKGNQNIYVNARWGYSEEAPGPIRFAATVLVSGIINFSESGEGEVQSMTIGRYSVTYKTKKEWQDFETVKSILDQFQKQDII